MTSTPWENHLRRNILLKRVIVVKNSKNMKEFAWNFIKIDFVSILLKWLWCVFLKDANIFFAINRKFINFIQFLLTKRRILVKWEISSIGHITGPSKVSVGAHHQYKFLTYLIKGESLTLKHPAYKVSKFIGTYKAFSSGVNERRYGDMSSLPPRSGETVNFMWNNNTFSLLCQNLDKILVQDLRFFYP